jgi:hypothetical protein
VAELAARRRRLLTARRAGGTTWVLAPAPALVGDSTRAPMAGFDAIDMHTPAPANRRSIRDVIS